MRTHLCASFAALVVLLGTQIARAADLDPYLPDDTEAVVSINVRQILDAPIFKHQAFDTVRKSLEERSGSLKHLKDLDLDPQKDIDSLVLAMTGGDPDRALLIVRGRFETAKFEAKAIELAKTEPKKWKITLIPDGAGGQYKVLQSTQWLDFSGVQPRLTNKPAYVALLDKRVLVASPAKDLIIDALDKAKGRKRSDLKSKELKNLLEKANGKQSVWVAALPRVIGKLLPKDDDSGFKDELEKVEALSGGITIDEEVKVELALAVQDATVARELSSTINDGVNFLLTFVALTSREKKELEPALDALKTIKATTKGNAIIVKAAISAEIVQKALKGTSK